jgi:hypothetical protein
MIPPNANDSRHSVTITTDETVKPKLAIPIHFDDYDVFKSPLSDFTKAVATPVWKTAFIFDARRGDNFQWHGEDAVMNAPQR